MKRISKFEMEVVLAVVCVLALLVFALAGCSKKQDQKGGTASDSNSPAKTSQKQDMPASPPQAETSAPKGPNSLSHAAGLSTEVNRPAHAPKLWSKKPAKPSARTETGKQHLEAAQVESVDSALKHLDGLTSPDEKIDFISEYTDAHPEAAPVIVNKALDDKNPAVRSAAMESLADKEVPDPEAVALVEKALKDTDEQIRQDAVELCSDISDPKVGKILAQALADPSEDVRAAAISVADEKDKSIRLDVLKQAVTSPYEDVKDSSLSSLIDMSSPQAVDVLITALKDPNPQFHEDVKSAISFLVSQDFETYDQAKKWWDANRNKYDEDLIEKD